MFKYHLLAPRSHCSKNSGLSGIYFTAKGNLDENNGLSGTYLTLITLKSPAHPELSTSKSAIGGETKKFE